MEKSELPCHGRRRSYRKKTRGNCHPENLHSSCPPNTMILHGKTVCSTPTTDLRTDRTKTDLSANRSGRIQVRHPDMLALKSVPSATVGLLLGALALCTLVSMVTGAAMPLRGAGSLDLPPPAPGASTPGCQLGERFYSLDDTWSPELEPVGVMHCIVCQCQRVIKKGVLQGKGRVNCRNIKHDCPPVNCTNPELKPGHCCKLCEGQEFELQHTLSLKRFPSFRFRSDGELPHAAAPRGKTVHRPSLRQDYLAVMVGANSPAPTLTSGVARGRFTLSDNTLYFSIHFIGLEQPRQLRIVDVDGTVMFLHNVIAESNDNQLLVCGVWRGLTSVDVIKLNGGHLVAMLSTAEVGGGLVAGSISTHRAIAKETFSAILRQSHQRPTGSGGVLMATVAGNGNINFMVKMAALNISTSTNRTVGIRFQRGGRVLLQTSAELLGPDLEFGEVWADLSTKQSRMLVRGAIDVTVETSAGMTYSGDVTVKQTCNVLHAVMSGGAAIQASRDTGAAGSALINIRHNGTLQYNVRLSGMRSRVTELSLEMAPNKRGRTRKLCRMTPQVNRQQTSFDAWANGTCGKLNARLVHALLHADVYVNVVTRDVALSALRGVVRELFYNPDLDKRTDAGTLLSGAALSRRVGVDIAGNAWARLDNACALHYQLVVSGLERGQDPVLTAQLVTTTTVMSQGGRKKARDDGAPQFTLAEFVGNVASGVAVTLTPVLYQKLNRGQVLLRVTTKALPNGVIGATLHLPNRCVAKGAQSNTLGILNDQEDVMSRESRRQLRQCNVDGVVYNDGDVWVPNNTRRKCMTCHCKGGQEDCHHTVCPDPGCSNPVQLDGECCPQCTNDTGGTERKCYFDGDKRWHGFGTRWHPYMPPFGYMTCAVCSCSTTVESGQGRKGSVSCSRKSCPLLNCLDSEAIRKDPADCCKVCPERQNTSSPFPGMQGDVATTGSCAFRGRRYPSGVTWHPRVQPFGRLPCVTCHCTSGATRCQRQKCPELKTCRRKIIRPNVCCPLCADDDETGTISTKQRRRNRSTTT